MSEKNLTNQIVRFLVVRKDRSAQHSTTCDKISWFQAGGFLTPQLKGFTSRVLKISSPIFSNHLNQDMKKPSRENSKGLISRNIGLYNLIFKSTIGGIWVNSK